MLILSGNRKGSLLKRLEEGYFEHAVFLTYSLDIPFFEKSVVRHLLRRGCRSISVFADARRLTHELMRLTEPGLVTSSWGFGRHYSLTPVWHTSAFHPKVALLIGEEIELVVGSGNLEPGGLNGNLEILHRVVCDRGGSAADARPLITQVWEYVARRVAGRAPTYVREQLGAVEDAIPWITRVEAGGKKARLVLGPGTDAVEALARTTAGDQVDMLLILSPFFDEKLAALRRLTVRLRPHRIVLLLQPETVSIPGSEIRTISNLELYRLDQSTSLYVHAKVVIAECRRSSVLLAGSHNVTLPALDGINFEAGLIRILPPDNRFSEELGLSQQIRPERRINIDDTSLVLRAREIDGGRARNVWLLGAQLDGDYVEVVTRRKPKGISRLVPCARGKALAPLPSNPLVSDISLRFLVDDLAAAAEWTAVCVDDDGERSAPVPLLHIDRLSERARPNIDKRVREKVCLLHRDLSVLPDLLRDFSKLLMSDTETEQLPRKPSNSNERKQQGKGPPKLSYEDFLIPWQASPQSGKSSPSSKSGLELVVGAIARAVGGTRRPTKQLEEVEELAIDEDAELANRAVYVEEAIAEGRLETSVEAVRELEFEPVEEGLIVQGEADGEAGPINVPSRRQMDEQTKLKSLRRAQSLLRRFAESFPGYVNSRCAESQLPLDLFEKITDAGRLLTAMVGREERVAKEVVELVSWNTWSKFHVDLLHSMASESTGFLRRFPWERLILEIHRRIIERFVGYLGVVQALCRLPYINPESRARIMIGLFRTNRILGIDRGKLRESVIREAANEILAVMKPDFDPPRLEWTEWVAFVRHLQNIDMKLRRRFGIAKQIADARAGATSLSVGDWIWWPHTQGHVATVVSSDRPKVEVACEPRLTKRVLSAFVVLVPARPPSATRLHRSG